MHLLQRKGERLVVFLLLLKGDWGEMFLIRLFSLSVLLLYALYMKNYKVVYDYLKRSLAPRGSDFFINIDRETH